MRIPDQSPLWPKIRKVVRSRENLLGRIRAVHYCVHGPLMTGNSQGSSGAGKTCQAEFGRLSSAYLGSDGNSQGISCARRVVYTKPGKGFRSRGRQGSTLGAGH